MAEELVPAAVLRQISDKLYERRKLAALEIEQIVKHASQRGEQDKIRKIVDLLIASYAFSPQPNHRKGALLCLAAATVGLGSPTLDQLKQIVPPVIASFTDQDPRVRYYACEALYNIAKVARETFLQFFNEVFDAMFRLCADPEANVQNAVQFLDNLVKDIVAASPGDFNIARFIPKLRACLPVTEPRKRQFIISWVTVLDSVPDLDMLAYLPQLLDGLMAFLSDANKEIRVAAHKAMMEFLIEIHATRTVDFAGMAATLVGQAGSSDEFTRLTALKWIKEFVEMAAHQLVGLYPPLLAVVLANIGHPSREIAEVSKQANDALLALAPADGAGQGGLQLDTRALLATISAELLRGSGGVAGGPGGTDGTSSLLPGGPGTLGSMASGGGAAGVLSGGGAGGESAAGEASRLEALRWVEFLLARARAAVLEQLPALLPALLDSLLAQSEAVAEGALGVFAAIAACPGQFKPALVALLGRFRGEAGATMLQRGGALVVRRLCGALGPEPVFLGLAGALQEEADLAFASTMVQALNLILLTSPEVRDLREALRGAAAGASAATATASAAAGAAPAAAEGQEGRGAALFVALYPCWAHSPGALLSLCLLAQAYDHAYDIIQTYRWLPMGSEVLVQVDRLVQLLDSPPFTFLRLQLLQPRQHAPLLRALHGLLALLPQSNAFRMLATRLQAVPTQALLQLEELCPAPSLDMAAAAAAASAPSTAPTMAGRPRFGPSGAAAEGAGAEQGAGPSSGTAGSGSTKWQDVDWAALLKTFCAKQQLHYLVEIGEYVVAGNAGAAGQGAAAAALAPAAKPEGVPSAQVAEVPLAAPHPGTAGAAAIVASVPGAEGGAAASVAAVGVSLGAGLGISPFPGRRSSSGAAGTGEAGAGVGTEGAAGQEGGDEDEEDDSLAPPAMPDA